nr:immunoglobulin light chain junction region [Macaca mulatta]MOV75904.1 immunoglobulin light chain junction region [Macaca mulatta]MOV76097.1 immunoglobulin light chain junction region [Macaca mulatta]MOV76283.1 immunoglobulin light chain junction region [Macaca mulatta]MOV76475.1 immunoglobulin light chain junction region [Macaca mulatta]
CHNGYGFPLTF